MEKNYFTHNHDPNPQILTWILLETEKPQTVIPGRNKALYSLELLLYYIRKHQLQNILTAIILQHYDGKHN